IPLDGGRLIEALFAGSKEIVLSFFIVISMILVALLAYYLESYFILVLIIFLFFRIRALWRTKAVRKDLKSRDIDYHKSYSELSDEEYGSIRNVLLKHIPEIKNNEETIMN